MLRFAADEDFDNRIGRGRLRLLASQIRRAASSMSSSSLCASASRRF